MTSYSRPVVALSRLLFDLQRTIIFGLKDFWWPNGHVDRGRSEIRCPAWGFLLVFYSSKTFFGLGHGTDRHAVRGTDSGFAECHVLW